MARTRSRHRDYCALCGVTLDQGYSVTQQLPWDYKVRAVCFEAISGRPFLTSAGIMSRHHILADVDHTVSYTDPGAVLTRHRLSADDIRNQITAPLAFGFHDACWVILLARITPDQEPERHDIGDVAARLYEVLSCLYGNRYKDLDPGLDYGGAWRLPRWSSSNPGVLKDHEPPFVFSDPFQVSVVSTPPQACSTNSIQGAYQPGDLFYRIPREVIVSILMHLPSIDLCNLRLASRSVASTSSPDSLPSSFWRSRFYHGFEMAFYLAGQLPDPPTRDWRVLYRQIRHCLTKPSDGHRGLFNRRRIWNILGSLATTLETLLEGPPAKLDSTSQGSMPSFQPGMTVRVRRRAYEDIACPFTTVVFTWDIDGTISPASIEAPSSIKMSISFIHLDGQSYICGLRATTSTPVATISQVGWIRPKTEQHIYLKRGQELTELRVVCSAMGVVGIKFLIQTTGFDSFQSTAWQSVGTTSMSQGGLAIAELKPSGKLLRLAVEFDACKCISIGLLESSNGGEQVLTSAPPLWFPDIPTDFQFSNQSSEDESQYCLRMDFGGSQGERLPLLNRITPFLDSGGLLRGMAFYYDDGTELIFGSRRVFYDVELSIPCLEPSFEIRGSAGERIIRINCKASGATWSSGPHFQIETNVGFKSTLGKHNQSHLFPEDWLSVGSSEYIITELFTHMTDYEGRIKELEVRHLTSQTTESPYNHPNSLVVSQEVQDIAWYGNRLRRLECMSGIKITGIRSIHFSRGDDGHSRSRKELCGMLIRFWETDHPLILGQWIREIEGTCIELREGEKLTDIAVWYIQVTPESRHARDIVNPGRVSGVRLRTSKSQLREIRLEHDTPMLFVQYRDNPVEEITGLVWSFNCEWEYIHVVREPRLVHIGTELVAWEFEKHVQHFSNRHEEHEVHDLEMLFWQEMDPETHVAYELVAIDSFFYHRPRFPNRFALVGIRFRYTHGMEREVGRCATEMNIMMESVSIGDDQLTHFERIFVHQELRVLQDVINDQDDEDVGDWDHRDEYLGRRVAFYFASGRVVSVPTQAGPATGKRDLFALGSEMKPLSDETGILEEENLEIHGMPPRSRCSVGIWVQMMLWPYAVDWVKDIGPLFHCDISQASGESDENS